MPAAIEHPRFVAAWDDEADDAQLWTQWLSEDLEARGGGLIDLIPDDAGQFCETWPSLARRDREQVWIMLISAIAEHESDFDPQASFMEPEPLNERSIGLMQLSLSDAREFRCGFTTEFEIENPRLNLKCAVHILTALVLRDGVIGGGLGDDRLGAAGYWSVLNQKGHADSRAFILEHTNTLPACHRR